MIEKFYLKVCYLNFRQNHTNFLFKIMQNYLKNKIPKSIRKFCKQLTKINLIFTVKLNKTNACLFL